MAASARLEIHVINVGQGDSILIVNRKLDVLRDNLKTQYSTPTTHTDYNAVVQAEDVDLLPWAMKAQRAKMPNADKVMRGTVEKALLIDGAEACYGEDVVTYLEAQGVLDPKKTYHPHLSVLVTHYHSDHIAGLLNLFQKVNLSTTVTDLAKLTKRGTSIRRRATKTTKTVLSRYRPAHIYYTKADDANDPGTKVLETLRACFHTAATTDPGSARHEVRPGGLIRPLQGMSVSAKPGIISLGTGVDGIPIQMRLIAASCAAYDPITGKEVWADKVSTDPNDHSIVGVLEYGSFRAFLGGDIAGNGNADGGNSPYIPPADGKKFYSSHGDIEKVVVRALRATYPAKAASAGQAKAKTVGHCTVYKASHHASSSSNDIHTLSTMQPRVAAISSGIKQRYHKHPTSEVLDRMTKPATWGVSGSRGTVPNTVKKGVYITEMAAKYGGVSVATPPSDVRLIGDIVIRPIDGSIKAIQDAAAFGNKLKVQVFGTGIQTVLTGKGSSSRSFRACTIGTPTAPYPIGPHMHECDEH